MDGKFFQKVFQKSSKDSLKSSLNRCLGVVLRGFLMLNAGFFWKANLWRQAFLESKFEEAVLGCLELDFPRISILDSILKGFRLTLDSTRLLA